MPLAPIDLYTVRSGIQFWEHGDIAEAWAPDGAELTRRLRCRWRDRFLFVADMLGFTENTVDGSLWVRHVPESYPHVGDVTFSGVAQVIPQDFRAVSCRLVEPLGVPGQDVEGELTYYERDAEGNLPSEYASAFSKGDGYAVYDVTYRTLKFNVKEDGMVTTELDRYVIRRPKFAIENLTIPSQSFEWAADGTTGNPTGAAVPAGLGGKAIAGDLTKAFPTMALTYEWLQIPKMPSATILAQLGKVNNATFDSNFGAYPAETLLFHSIEPRDVIHGTGQVYYDLVFQFLFRPTGWNKLYKPDNATDTYGDFYQVVNRNAGKPAIYDTYNFNTLFQATSY